jgi:hypothetical protein
MDSQMRFEARFFHYDWAFSNVHVFAIDVPLLHQMEFDEVVNF